MQHNPATVVRKKSVFCESHYFIFSPKSGRLKSTKLNFPIAAHLSPLSTYEAALSATMYTTLTKKPFRQAG